MTPVKLRKKKVLIFVSFTSFIYLFCYAIGIHPFGFMWDVFFFDQSYTRCNNNIRWKEKSYSKNTRHGIALLGPEGSGVEWLRFLIEETSGTYTGSVYNKYPRIFRGEAVTDLDKVLTVLSHSISKVPDISAAIVVYRPMKDCVRTHFARLYGARGHEEGPSKTYHDDTWQTFAKYKGRVWSDNYKLYLGSKKSLLIIDYEDLHNKETLQKQLKRISTFLGISFSSSVFDCLIEHNDFPLKPKPLKEGFQPFNLLPRKENENLQLLSGYTESLVDKYDKKVR